MLYQSTTAFLPVTAVHIDQTVDGLDGRRVNVAADHTVKAPTLTIVNQVDLKLKHMVHSLLDVFLELAALALLLRVSSRLLGFLLLFLALDVRLLVTARAWCKDANAMLLQPFIIITRLLGRIAKIQRQENMQRVRRALE